MFGWTSDVQRLKTRPQFQAALACGIVARSTHFALHRTALLPAAPAEAGVSGESQSRHPKLLLGVQDVWIGAMVPKRWARRAVTRNAIRRRIIYEANKDVIGDNMNLIRPGQVLRIPKL